LLRSPRKIENWQRRVHLARSSGKGLGEKPTIHETIAQQPEIHLAGLPKNLAPATFVEMPGLWQSLVPLIGSKGQLGHDTYGVRRKRYPAEGAFDFFAAVPAAWLPKVEDGWIGHYLPIGS
jgi:hypothetical protein